MVSKQAAKPKVFRTKNGAKPPRFGKSKRFRIDCRGSRRATNGFTTASCSAFLRKEGQGRGRLIVLIWKD